jgi:hypothetical protein
LEKGKNLEREKNIILRSNKNELKEEYNYEDIMELFFRNKKEGEEGEGEEGKVKTSIENAISAGVSFIPNDIYVSLSIA